MVGVATVSSGLSVEFDPFGDHRPACAQSGVLRARGERESAQQHEEVGARVTTNTRLADFNISAVRMDGR